MNNLAKLLLGLLILVIIAVIYVWYDSTSLEEVTPNFETDELTLTTDAKAYSFDYPESLTDPYVTTVDWPPQLQVLSKPLTCTEAGSTTARAGRTESRNIAGEDFCVTQIDEGAAGSVYHQYAYAMERSGYTFIYTFSVRAVQCQNYDDPEQTACHASQAAFKPDVLASNIANSTSLNGELLD